ncbi:MAG: YdeI/OmpD-associated family protein [Acidobacteriaceae bacterium]
MKQTFTVKLVARGPNGAWTHLDVPFSVEQTWGTRARVAVRGTVNGFPFRSSLMPRGGGVFYMAFTRAMQEGAKARAGDTVSVVMEPDSAPRTVEVPAYLKEALKAAPAKGHAFAALSYSHKKEYVDWIAQAKKPETRAARIEKMLHGLGTKKTPKE